MPAQYKDLSAEAASGEFNELAYLHELLRALIDLEAMALEIARRFRDVNDRMELANRTAEFSKAEVGFTLPRTFNSN